MPLLFVRNVAPDVALGIWKIEESVDAFFYDYQRLERMKPVISVIKSEQRRREVLAVRLLIDRMLGPDAGLRHNADGKPFLDNGMNIVGGMTENHLMTLDLRGTGKTGKDMANVLELVGITANKNTVPNDPQSPFITSGIRLGAAAVTTRGFKEEDMKEIAGIIADAVTNSDNDSVLKTLKEKSLALCLKHPLY